MDETVARIKSIFPAALQDRVYLVGGMVRDLLMGIPCQDVDLAAALSPDDLTPLGFRLVQSKSTPDIHFFFDKQLGKVEVTLLPSPEALASDLARRDFTVNAMAMTLSGDVIDPLGGRKDLEDRVLRACSDAAFHNDPGRIFRALRFECEGWRLHPDAERAITGHDWSQEFGRVPVERFSQEMLKALAKAEPTRFFCRMLGFGVGKNYLPEIFLMADVPAGPPQHHPEGDLFTHSMQVLEKTAQHMPLVKARFCGLFHDLGKLSTPKELHPKHHGHEEAGAEAAAPLCRQLRLPVELQRALQATCRVHGAANRWEELRDSTRIGLALDAIKAGIDGFLPLVVMADCGRGMPGWEETLQVAALNAEQLGIDPALIRDADPEKSRQLLMHGRIRELRRKRQGR